MTHGATGSSSALMLTIRLVQVLAVRGLSSTGEPRALDWVYHSDSTIHYNCDHTLCPKREYIHVRDSRPGHPSDMPNAEPQTPALGHHRGEHEDVHPCRFKNMFQTTWTDTILQVLWPGRWGTASSSEDLAVYILNGCWQSVRLG